MDLPEELKITLDPFVILIIWTGVCCCVSTIFSICLIRRYNRRQVRAIKRLMNYHLQKEQQEDKVKTFSI
jgi:small neutral amino acid transporter SnatA (MarC family)